MNIEFMECESCASKSGAPILCKSCLYNRSVINILYRAMTKIADNIWGSRSMAKKALEDAKIYDRKYKD